MYWTKNQSFGLEGEQYVVDELARRGYEVEFLSRFTDAFDLRLLDCGLLIECKISNPHQHAKGNGYAVTRWQWNCQHIKRTVDHLYILIAKEADNCHPFIVPSWDLILRDCAVPSITSTPNRYRGWLKPYLHNWSLIETVKRKKTYFADGQLAMVALPV